VTAGTNNKLFVEYDSAVNPEGALNSLPQPLRNRACWHQIEESSMAYETTMRLPLGTLASARPLVTSYDSGYEHSLEHCAEVQRLVEDADNEPTLVSAPLQLMAMAS